MLHEFSGGHLAPLALWANTPIIASSPVHNLWAYRQIIPNEFLNGETNEKYNNVLKYFDLMNVSVVFAHEHSWRDFFRGQPEKYIEVEKIGNFSLFKRTSFPNNYFLEGSGKILAQHSNKVIFSTNTPDAVLKFNWFPFLEIKGCEVFPFKVSESITFIKVSSCPINTELVINSVGPIRRWSMG
jgi:hypothetical protein